MLAQHIPSVGQHTSSEAGVSPVTKNVRADGVARQDF